MRILLVTCCWILAFPVKAEIHECNGTWTNKPCEDAASKSMAEVPPREHKEDPLAKRRVWLQDLRTQYYKARRDHGILVNIQSVEDMCLDVKFSAETCSQLIGAKEKDLNELILKSKEVKAKEARNKIEAEKQPDTIQFITNTDNYITVRGGHSTPFINNGSGIGINNNGTGTGITNNSSGIGITAKGTTRGPLAPKKVEHISPPPSHESASRPYIFQHGNNPPEQITR